jgi:hypothetical protein
MGERCCISGRVSVASRPMEFAVAGYLSKDGKKILLFSNDARGVYAATVACEDIRQEFGVDVSNKLLRELATIRETNRSTLSEIADSLVDAGRDKLVGLYHVVEITREDLAAKRTHFAWGKSDIPPIMGIVEQDLPEMTSREIKERKEQDVVERLLGLLGYSGFSVSNPNSSNEETGADVLVRLNEGKIGFQVTEYQPDRDKKGSRLREKEAVRVKVGLITAMSINPFSMEFLKQIVSQKAKKKWSQTAFPDMRLVVAASVPQLGGTASTQLLPGRVKVAEMNTHLSPILEQTSYSAAYLYVMMHEAVYEWTRKSGWKTHPATAR